MSPLRANAHLVITLIIACLIGLPAWADGPDVNDDGIVNIYDASIVGSCFRAEYEQLPICEAADIDKDGLVTRDDLALVIAAFNNSAPSASAGDDQSVLVSDVVVLDGSASFDPDGDDLSFAWQLISKPLGSQASLLGADTVSPSFTADIEGLYLVELVVDDDVLFSQSDTTTITALIPANQAPIADAGADQSVLVGDTVTLDGSGSSDVDGDPLTFAWSLTSVPAGSTATLSDPTAVQPTLDVDVAGSYVVQLVVNDGNVDSAPDSVTISTDNSAPVADAGTDQSVLVGDTVTLDGSGSSDVDGDPLTFAWSLTSVPAGSTATLSDPTAVQPTFDVDVAGSYVVQLVVNDGQTDSAADSVTINTDNSAPVADAGADQSVLVGDTVTLDGSGSSDVDGDPLTFNWSLTSVPAGSTATLSDPTAVQPTFDVDVAGSYVVQLVVNDGNVDSAPDNVTISTDNSAPVADAGTDQSVLVGDTVTLDGSGSSDVDGDPLTFNWSLTSVPAGSTATLSDPTAVQPTLDVDVAGSYVVQLVVNDGNVDSAPDNVTISTDNSAPVADAGADQSVLVGDTVTLDGSGSSDVDGDPLTFNWSLTSVPAGSTATLSDPTAVQPTFDVDVAGSYVVQLVVNDGQTDSAADNVTISTDNSAPVADAGTDQSVLVGDTVTLDGSGSSDVDGDPLTFAWSLTSVPAGSTATLSDPTAVQPTLDVDVAGSYVVQLVVNDGNVDSAPDSVTISTDNSAPVADAGTDQSVLVGDTVTLDGSGSFDVDLDALSYFWSLVSVPPSSQASLVDAGTVTPSFDADLAGDYVAQLIVDDGLVNSAPDSVTVTVVTPNQAPSANAGADQSVDVGDTVTLDGTGSSDPDGDPLTYSWTLSTPVGSGASLSDATDATPMFTADVAGSYTATLVVNDGSVDSAPDSVDITVVTPNQAPSANAGADQSVDVGDTVTLDGTGSSDPDGDPLTYSWTLSTPVGSGASLSDATAAGPTFTADVAGSYTATLVVNDGSVDSAPDSVDITVVTPNQAPSANAGADQSVDVGDTVTLDGTGSSDPDGDPLTYSWTLSTPVGSGASLSDPTAAAPTFTADVAGSYTATLVVNDGSVDSAPDSVSVIANAVTVVNTVDDSSATISDQSLIVDVLGNDSPLGLTLESVTQPANGWVGANADGTITYEQAGLHDTPVGLANYKTYCSSCHHVSSFNGTDTFTYTAGNGTTSDTATVSVAVTTFDGPTSRADISGWSIPSCITFENLNRNHACTSSLNDAALLSISDFLSKGFSVPLTALRVSTASLSAALPGVDLRIGTLVVPNRISGQDTSTRAGEIRLSVCNDGAAAAAGITSLKGDSVISGTAGYRYTMPFAGLASGTCTEQTVVWQAPDYATSISWTAEVETAAGLNDPNDSNNSASARTLVFPLRR